MYVRDSKGDTPLGLSVRNKNPLKKLTREEMEVLEFTETSKDDLMIPPGNSFKAIFCCIFKSFILLQAQRVRKKVSQTDPDYRLAATSTLATLSLYLLATIVVD